MTEFHNSTLARIKLVPTSSIVRYQRLKLFVRFVFQNQKRLVVSGSLIVLAVLATQMQFHWGLVDGSDEHTLTFWSGYILAGIFVLLAIQAWWVIPQK